MSNLRSLSISAALALAIVGLSGGLSSADAQSAQPQPVSGFSRVFAQLGNLLPTQHEAASRPAQTGDLARVPTARWGDVTVSHKIGDCGLNCRVGIAE